MLDKMRPSGRRKLMQVDDEFSDVIKNISTLRARIAVAESSRWENEIVALRSELGSLSSDLNELRAYVLASSDFLRKRMNESQDELADVGKSMSNQDAMLSRIMTTMQAVQTQQASSEAIRALIAAHDQLAVVYAHAGPHSDVIQGQRDNLEQTLSQLGVRLVAQEVGNRFDATRMQSESQTIPTDDSGLDGCVAGQVETGWERADGSGLVRVPRVRVFERTPESAVAAQTLLPTMLAAESRLGATRYAYQPLDEEDQRTSEDDLLPSFEHEVEATEYLQVSKSSDLDGNPSTSSNARLMGDELNLKSSQNVDSDEKSMPFADGKMP